MMILTNLDYAYCTKKYDKPECPRCRRNIMLYEKYDGPLFWVDHFVIEYSSAPVCPFYKTASKGIV